MQIAELLRVDFGELRVVELQEFLQGAEVDVVGGVEGLRGPVYVVRHRYAPPKDRGVLDIVNPKPDK